MANTFASKLTQTCDLDIAERMLKQTADFLRSQPDVLYDLQFQISVNDTKVVDLKEVLNASKNLMKTIKVHQL